MTNPKTSDDYRDQAAMEVSEEYALAVELLDRTWPSWRVDVPANQYDAAVERMMDSGLFARMRVRRALIHLVEVTFLPLWRRIRGVIPTWRYHGGRHE